MRIRDDIRKSLAAKLDDAQLAMAAEYIGRQFDEEIDKARRAEARRSGGSDSGSGSELIAAGGTRRKVVKTD